MVGFVAAWLAGFYVEFTYQVLIAVVLGIVFLGIGNSISEKYIRNRIKNEPILVDKIVGQVFTAEDKIERSSQQKINGIYWAIVNDGETILPGESFRVVGIKENKLTVVKEETK
jgi:membrane protein implicated in regulation of membrane protease activity